MLFLCSKKIRAYIFIPQTIVIGPHCDATRGCVVNNKFKSTLVAVRSESKREENLKLRSTEGKMMMTKDEGYYSIEHNRHDTLRSKSDAATQTHLREGKLTMNGAHRATRCRGCQVGEHFGGCYPSSWRTLILGNGVSP